MCAFDIAQLGIKDGGGGIALVSRRFTGARILVVDDHPMVRAGLRSLLEHDLAAVVGEAANASDALDMLRREPWDLVIVDVVLGGRDGFDLLRDVVRGWRTPVLVMTGHAAVDFGVRALRGGAAGFLTKAAAPTELVRVVCVLLGGERYVPSELASHLIKDTHLSDRELQVVRMVALGRSRKDIAEHLHLSERTVGTYRDRIAKKLGLSSSVELTRYAFRHGLVR